MKQKILIVTEVSDYSPPSVTVYPSEEAHIEEIFNLFQDRQRAESYHAQMMRGEFETSSGGNPCFFARIKEVELEIKDGAPALTTGFFFYVR